MNILADELLEQIKGDLLPALDIVARLQRVGYDDCFELVGDQLRCCRNQQLYSLKSIEVDEIFEFEDDSGLFKTICLYAIIEHSDNLKGIFMIEMKY